MPQRPCTRALAVLAAPILFVTSSALAQDFRLERVATGLQQPTHVVFAPGDNNTMYFMERTNGQGTSPVGTAQMGRIVKYDLTTQTKSTFIDFAGIGGVVPNDAGSLALTFHPDFQTNGKLYATYSYRNSSTVPVTNVLNEYKVIGGVPQFQRKILQYDGNSGSFHTIDWIGFKHLPAADPGRNHLYITTGDGGPQSNNPAYVAKSQNLMEIYGKVLRVDVSDGADDYASDPNKNFGIPTINHYPQTSPPKLGEVIASGFRNPYRASFDRATNDLFIGDVGFNTQEEIDFIKHEAINPLTLGTLYDFGWAKREGVIANPDSAPGIGGEKGSSIDPIIFRTATTSDDGVSDNSITGGYVYRGPIASLQGKYIFADYVAARVYAINFDRNTDPSTFNGTNYTNFADMTALLESAAAGGFDLTRISSFGEDNLGNLYLVSLADNLNSAYNSVNEGNIYRLVLVPEPTGAMMALACMAMTLLRRRAV